MLNICPARGPNSFKLSISMSLKIASYVDFCLCNGFILSNTISRVSELLSLLIAVKNGWTIVSAGIKGVDLFPSWTQLSSTNTNWWHSCPGLLLHLALRWSNFRLLQDLQTSGTSTSARKRKTICSFKNEKCYPTFSSGDCDLDTTELLKLFGLCIDDSQ